MPTPFGGKAKGSKHRHDWPAIRAEYEAGSIGLEALAQLKGLSVSTVEKRAAREKWRNRKKIVQRIARKLETNFDQQADNLVRDEMAPFIESKKKELTKLAVITSMRGLRRANTFYRQNKRPDAKSEADIARATESNVRVARVSLGMNDGAPPTSPLTLAVLGGHVAVQINQAGVNPP